MNKERKTKTKPDSSHR